jgi:hypothetical protein
MRRAVSWPISTIKMAKKILQALSYVLLAFLMLWPLDSLVYSAVDWLTLGGFYAIASISLFTLFRSGSEIRFLNAYLVFQCFFLGIVPSIQYRIGFFTWDDMVPVDRYLCAKINAFILLSNLLNLWLYQWVYKKSWQAFPLYKTPLVKQTISPVLAILALILLPCIAYWGLHWQPILLRPHYGDAYAYYSWQLLVMSLLKMLYTVIWLFWTHQVLFDRLKRAVALWLVGLAITLFWFIPTGIPRFEALLLYGIPMWWLLKKYWRSLSFSALSLIALSILFPLWSLLRIPFSQWHTFVGKDEFWTKWMRIGDFDVYGQIVRIVQYVDEQGLAMGKQLLGACLFFVPRSTWPDKPIGTGAHVMHYHQAKFANVSAPLWAEGFINFSYVGFLSLPLLAMMIVARLDAKWHNWPKTDHAKQVAWYGLLIFFLFILRGDLMSGFAQTMAFVAAYMVVKHILCKRTLA